MGTFQKGGGSLHWVGGLPFVWGSVLSITLGRCFLVFLKVLFKRN